MDLNVAPGYTNCIENHTGNTPRSIMTKGTSTRRKSWLPGYLYGNFDPGDQDKLMITYYRDPTHDYKMYGACGVIYQGDMHFFGGSNLVFSRVSVKYSLADYGISEDLLENRDFTKQHFVIETQRSGKMVKMMKLKDLD